MKPKISLRSDRRIVELGDGTGQALLRNPNVVDEVLPATGNRIPVSKDLAGSPPRLFGLNKVLVPIDFSNLSEKLLRRALQFVRPRTGRIILLHIVEPRSRRLRQARFGLTNSNRMDDAEKRLLALGERELEPTVKFDILVQSGKPYREVVGVAKALSADLIVIGTRGLAETRCMKGITAERVVRHAPCPVLVVPELDRNLFWPFAGTSKGG